MSAEYHNDNQSIQAESTAPQDPPLHNSPFWHELLLGSGVVTLGTGITIGVERITGKNLAEFTIDSLFRAISFSERIFSSGNL